MAHKRKNSKGFRKVLVNLPIEVSDALDKLLLNPYTGKTVYGGKSSLITNLIITHLKRQKKDLPNE